MVEKRGISEVIKEAMTVSKRQGANLVKAGLQRLESEYNEKTCCIRRRDHDASYGP